MANAKNTIQNIPLIGNLNLNTLKTDVSQFQGFNNKNSTMFGGELAPFYKIHNDYNNQFRSSNFMPIVTDDGQEYFMTLEKQLNASDHPELPRGTIVDKNNNTVFQGTIALPVTNEIDVPPDTIWATQMYSTLGILQVYITRNKLCWKVTDDPFQGGTTTNNIDIDYVVNPKKYLDQVEWHEYNYDFSDLAEANSVVAQCYVSDTNKINLYILYDKEFREDTGLLLGRMKAKVELYRITFSRATIMLAVPTYLWQLGFNSSYDIITPTLTTIGSGDDQKTIGDLNGTSCVSMTDNKIYLFEHSGKLKAYVNSSAIFTNTTIWAADFNPATGSVGSFSKTDTYDVAYPNTENAAITSLPTSSLFHHGTTASFDDISIPGTGYTKIRSFIVSPYYLDKCNFRFKDSSLPSGYPGPVSFSQADPETPAYNILYRGLRGWGPVITGHDGTGFIPRYMNIYGKNQADMIFDIDNNVTIGWHYADPIENMSYISYSMIENDIVAVNFCGVPVFQPNSEGFNQNTLTITGDNKNVGCSYKMGSKWYSFTGIVFLNNWRGNVSDILKNCIVNNQYVLFMSGAWDKNKSSETRNVIFDLSNKNIITGLNYLGYVPEHIPQGSTLKFTDDTETNVAHAAYASGYNVGYENNPSNPFIGYSPNASSMSFCPKDLKDMSIIIDYTNNILDYLTIGSIASSAKYIGKDPKYIDTIYGSSNVGNIIYPYTLTSKIIPGYFNNSMIKQINGSFPLIYYNNNSLKFGYFALANMYDIDGIFVVQTQQYTYDKNLIYSVTYENSILSNAVPVTYKKNMQYIGTLPTRAIFYSKYNKALYQFTGDAILSKMADASDINEIKAIYQNPATLALWINTDKGIYVLSDMDMFKLDYDPVAISFEDTKTLMVFNEKGSNGLLYLHSDALSYYPIENNSEIIPIKVSTRFYGIGTEQKSNYDCWYFRLHADDRRPGYVDMKIHTITDTSKETETKRWPINAVDYDENNIIYLKYQPKYQSAVAMQADLETNLGLYQVSLGINANDPVAQMAKNNF